MKIKTLMGVLASGRKAIETGESYQLRESQIPYGDHFGAKKIEIGPEKAYIWELSTKIQYVSLARPQGPPCHECLMVPKSGRKA